MKKRKRFVKTLVDDDPIANAGGPMSQPNITKTNP